MSDTQTCGNCKHRKLLDTSPSGYWRHATQSGLWVHCSLWENAECQIIGAGHACTFSPSRFEARLGDPSV